MSRGAVLLLAVIPIAASAPARADEGAVELSPQGRSLIVRRGGSDLGKLNLPEAPRQIAELPGLALVALGPAGLWVVDLADPARPKVAARLAEGKDVIGVLVAGDRTVHVVEASYAVESFDLSAPGYPRPVAFAAPAAGAPVSAAPAAGGAQGSVVQVVGGRAIVDRGSSDGLRAGDRLKILSQELAPKPNLLTGRTEMVPSNEPVAVLEVEMLDAHRASAPLHRGDVVHPGDRFVVTGEEPTERLLMPPRQDYRHRLAATLRPFIELGAVGVGFISELRYGYRLLPSLTVEAGLSPLAFEARRGSGPAQIPTSFDATAAYDTDFFAVGLGAGGMVFPAHDETVYPAYGGPPSTARIDSETHLAVVQVARLGNLDGLSAEIRNAFVLRSGGGGSSTFHWGSTEAHGYIPLARRLTLGLGGGGGNNGWAYGELGIRTYFRGTGGAGTIIVPVNVGFGGFTNSPSDSSGPLISIGVEMRL